MTFGQQWIRGAGTVATAAVMLFPGAFYSAILTGAVSFALKLAHVSVSDQDTTIIWSVIATVLIPYFVGGDIDRIVRRNSN